MRSSRDQGPAAAPVPSRPPPPPYSETDIYSDSTNRQPVFTPPETPPASLGPEAAPGDDVEPPPEMPSRPRRQGHAQQAPRAADPRGWLGFRFGDVFAADRSGLTIGGLVLGCGGLRLARRAEGGYAAGSWAPESDTIPGSGPDGPGPGEEAEKEKWQPYQRPRGRGRSASTSSATSATSASSSSASSSVVSMPDSGRMCVPQLSLYAARLRAWLATPDQMRTHAEVDELRADLGRVGDHGPDADPDPEAERLAAEIRDLGQQWKRLKRAQRRIRRLERRQRRSRRRAERRERRETRRARRAEATGTRAGIFPGLVPPPVLFPPRCPLPCRPWRPLLLGPGIPWSRQTGGRRWAPPPALSSASNDEANLAAGRERTSSRRHRRATEEQLWQLEDKMRQTQIEVDRLYAQHLALSSP